MHVHALKSLLAILLIGAGFSHFCYAEEVAKTTAATLRTAALTPATEAPATTPANNATVSNAATTNSTKTSTKTEPASKVPSIGQVVWVKGTVKAIGKETRKLQRRSPIYVHDTITTDKTSTGQIVFTDNSSVALAPDTSMKIDEYSYAKNASKGKSKYVASLVKGGFRTITGLIPKQNPDNYQVNTPVATIGVRGTSYAIKFKGELYMKYYSGSPCVNNAKGSVCLDKNNEFAKVDSSGAAPARLAKDPGVFADQPDIVPATFSAKGPITDGAGNMMPGGGIGPGGGGTGTGGGAVKNNSFCIQ